MTKPTRSSRGVGKAIRNQLDESFACPSTSCSITNLLSIVHQSRKRKLEVNFAVISACNGMQRGPPRRSRPESLYAIVHREADLFVTVEMHYLLVTLFATGT